MTLKSFFSVSISMSVIILILTSGCATREDFNRLFVERYVSDNTYTNELKGFSLAWPDDEIWSFRNYPEFDLSFDHIDGRSQFLVIGVNGLIRREFPDGFDAWVMERIQASEIGRLSSETLTTNEYEQYRVKSDCEFYLNFGESFGVKRRIDALLTKSGQHWVAVVCLCPPENYDEKAPLFTEIFNSLKML